MKKKIAVLHVQCPYMYGGAEIHTNNLTQQLKLRGYDAERVSIPFKWYPINTLLDGYAMWRMVDLTESNGEKIDAVIALKAPTFMVRHPNKVLWLMHQFRQAYDLRDNFQAGGLNTMEGGPETIEIIKKMDYLGISESKLRYANSKNVANRLKSFNGISSTPLYHPPVLVGRYYTEEYGNYVLSVGRLDKIKRVDLLIRSLNYCDKSVKAIITGNGTEKEELKKLAESIGVADRVKFTGFVSDEELLKLYANAMAVFFAPIDEDYGYITLEAFLSKKPVITCRDSGGVLEFAENGKNAIVCESRNPEEIGQAMDKLYANRKLIAEYGENGYNSVKNISWDNVIDALTETIR